MNIRLALLLSFLAACSTVRAQPGEWYQVELLVVEQPPASAASDEAWPPYPNLGYPDHGRFLVHPELLQARLTEYPAALSSAVDERGRQVLQLPAPGMRQPAAAQADTDLTPANPVEEHSLPEGMEDPAAVMEQPPRLPVPFVRLPASGHELRGKAAYMARNGNYRILLHERWWQPVGGPQQTPPVLLDHSGDGGAWPELQGSISLSRSRYLHLTARIWLNTDGRYLPGDWRMPAPPRSPASLVLERPAPRTLSWLLAPGVLPARADRVVFPAQPDTDTAPDWQWRHAILLEQQRRMSSGEIHYLDHPRLGLIIKLTPLDQATLEAADYDRDWYHLTDGTPLTESGTTPSGPVQGALATPSAAPTAGP